MPKTYDDYYDLIDTLDKMAAPMTDKEADFMESMAERVLLHGYDLSPKQKAWLDDLETKYL